MWDIFIRNKNRKYTYIGEMGFHPFAINIQPINKDSTKMVNAIIPKTIIILFMDPTA